MRRILDRLVAIRCFTHYAPIPLNSQTVAANITAVTRGQAGNSTFRETGTVMPAFGDGVAELAANTKWFVFCLFIELAHGN